MSKSLIGTLLVSIVLTVAGLGSLVGGNWIGALAFGGSGVAGTALSLKGLTR